jgi:hypothetical protein
VADPCWGDDGDAAWLRRNLLPSMLLLSMLLLLFLPLFMLAFCSLWNFFLIVEEKRKECPS